MRIVINRQRLARVIVGLLRCMISSCMKTPLALTLEAFLQHRGAFVGNPECPERLSESILMLHQLHTNKIINLKESVSISNKNSFATALHMMNSVRYVETMCKRGARVLDP